MAKFNEFEKKTAPAATDYVVGYDEATGLEIRIPVPNLNSKGDAGVSMDVQYSANGEDGWHYPALATDGYVRFRKGTDAWSFAFRIRSTDAALVEYSADGSSWSEVYSSGDAYLRINGGSAIRIKGEKGDKGEDGEDGEDGEGVTIEYSSNGVDAWGSTPDSNTKYIRFNGGDVIRIKGEKGEQGEPGAVDLSEIQTMHDVDDNTMLLVVINDELFQVSKADFLK